MLNAGSIGVNNEEILIKVEVANKTDDLAYVTVKVYVQSILLHRPRAEPPVARRQLTCRRCSSRLRASAAGRT